MPTVTARLNSGAASRLVRELKRDMDAAARAELSARRQAATTATRITRESFTYKRPFNVPPRAGRESSQGKFTNALRWQVTAGPVGEVQFDVAAADARVPYWIIQEIGTGQSATLKRGGSANPRGRPQSGASYVRTVRSQRGRVISPNLAWASGPTGVYTPPGNRRDQQLYLISQLTGPRGGRVRRRRRPLYIGREIQGQHFVKRGGTEGFREYNDTVLAAARRAFTRKGA